uniref:Uncharacterized protein n=1 Tax=Rhizophora mucronata TaxID=61149 RepID=A0A2P2Q778_RHIMU
MAILLVTIAPSGTDFILKLFLFHAATNVKSGNKISPLLKAKIIQMMHSCM